jgi:hypothetical protein
MSPRLKPYLGKAYTLSRYSAHTVGRAGPRGSWTEECERVGSKNAARAPAPSRALTIRSNAEAIASARSAPLIFVSLCRSLSRRVHQRCRVIPRVQPVGRDHGDPGPRNAKGSGVRTQHLHERVDGGRRASPAVCGLSGLHGFPTAARKPTEITELRWAHVSPPKARNLRNSVSLRERRNSQKTGRHVSTKALYK